MSTLKGVVFVAGASRSGTTMLNRILGQNPAVCAMNELHYFGDLFEIGEDQTIFQGHELLKKASKLFARYRRGLWKGKPEEADIKSAQVLINSLYEPIDGVRLFQRFLEYVADESDSSLVAEQTPRNIYYAADLLKAYPDARILHIVRDPRAVIASQKRRWSRRKTLNANNIPILEMVREWISYHPYTMSLLWKKAFIAGQSIESSDRYLRIRFEELVEDPQQVVRQVCKFIKVPFDEKMLNIPQIDSSVRAVDNAVVGIQKSAVETWKSVLSAGEVQLIEYCLLAEMKNLGYHPQSSNTGGVYLSFLPIALRFPFHLLGTFVVNPQRFLIQLKGIVLKK